MPKKNKEYVPPIETLPPRMPLTLAATVDASKEFPLAKGDMLIVRNQRGRVTHRYDVGDHLFTYGGDGQKRVSHEAKLTIFDRV